ncbi:MAG: hypothetical protein PHV03_11665 [Desulfitobacteriaceae bacterium]|nr:hypothetical protein [Desulfitobacteriaceae bacterium]
MQKKQWSPEQKLLIVLEALKEECAILAKLPRNTELHVSVIHRWKKELLEGADKVFATIKAQAGLLSLNRTGLYWTAKKVSKHEVEIKNLIDKIHTRHPFKGSRRTVDDMVVTGGQCH